MQAQMAPQTSPCRSSSRFTYAGSMWAGSSIASSTKSKPHSLNCLKSFVLELVNGAVNRNVLMPNFIAICLRLEERWKNFKLSFGEDYLQRQIISGE